ncbi:MAG: sulfotransferase family protein [Pseudomonadales bacterium]|nr:sulfotransferase family protein [Pseudomonadales bacterium]
MISEEKKCIFIHIPKTAGTSIESLLGKFERLERGSQDHRTIREIQSLDGSDCLVLLKRGGPIELAREFRGLIRYTDRLTRRELESYFKFTFVRNPWARVHSWYRNVIRDETHQKNRKIPSDCTLYDFLTRHSWQTELRPQLDWITDRGGAIVMDHVAKFESLNEELQVIGDKLKIDIAELPHLVPSASENYRSEYDNASREYVAQRYKDEISLFNYTFD